MTDTEWLRSVGATQKQALNDTDRVLADVRVERARQFMKWGWGLGGADVDLVAHQHDDAHVEGDWTRFTVRYLGRAEQAIEDGDPVAWREAMIQVAALAVAAIESRERKRLSAVPYDESSA